VSNPIKQGLKVKTAEDYSTLFVNLSGVPDSVNLVVEVIDNGDKQVRKLAVGKERTAEFFYLKPGSYYLRAFEDWNGNGVWDTGCYDEDRQAEPVYYYPEVVECKQKWDVSRSWNLTSTPRYQQKPQAITKQKPDKQKQLKNRNIERAREKGIKYMKEQGVNL
jgi:hypothetical protein